MQGKRERDLPEIFFQVDLECLSFLEKQQHLESFRQRYNQLPWKEKSLKYFGGNLILETDTQSVHWFSRDFFPCCKKMQDRLH